MADFSANPTRPDPYRNFKFRVNCDDRYVAGVSKVGAPRRTTDLVERRSGGDPQHCVEVAWTDEVRAHYAGAGRHPRHGVRAMGVRAYDAVNR